MPLRPGTVESAFLLASLLLVGCAGKVLSPSSTEEHSGATSAGASGGSGGGSGVLGSSGSAGASGLLESSGNGGGSGAGASSGSAAGDGGDGGICVDIHESGYDRSCQHNTDCIAIASGPICSGYTCVCPGGAAINVSEQARYQSELSSVRPGTGPLCSCPVSARPECLGGVCTMCRGLLSDPPACGSTVVDAGQDGSACVDVDLATYDQSCQSASDCMGITAGVLCPRACTCGGAAVNVAERLRYQTTVARLGTLACPCAAPAPIACVQNRCTVCGFGPNQPAGCPDGG